MKIKELVEKVDTDTSKDATKKDMKDGKSSFDKLKKAAKDLDVAKKELKKNPFEAVVLEGKLEKLIDKYLDANKMYHFEGDTGVKHLEKLVSDIGYKGHGFKYGTPVESFLSDNPGAMDAIVEWIKEQNVPEWIEALSEEDADEDEDEDEDEDDEDLDESLTEGQMDGVTVGHSDAASDAWYNIRRKMVNHAIEHLEKALKDRGNEFNTHGPMNVLMILGEKFDRADYANSPKLRTLAKRVLRTLNMTKHGWEKLRGYKKLVDKVEDLALGYEGKGK